MPGWCGVEDDMIIGPVIAAKRPANSSNAAISVVQAPDNCSRTVFDPGRLRPVHLGQHPHAIGLGGGGRSILKDMQTLGAGTATGRLPGARPISRRGWMPDRTY